MEMTDLIARFTQFLPVWTKQQGIVLSPADKELGDDLLMALGTLYLSLMLSEKPALDLPPAILSKTNAMFAPLLMGILEDIKLDTLVRETLGRQEILDSLYQAIYIQFELAAKEA